LITPWVVVKAGLPEDTRDRAMASLPRDRKPVTQRNILIV
jgi:hypothetical protein